jgi:hypothetical protein
MASATAPARAFYGAISPAILGGFDWEEEEDVQSSASTAQVQPLDQPPVTTAQSVGTTVFSYRPLNISLLRELEDDAVSLASGMATDGGSVAGEDAGGVELGERQGLWTQPTSPPLEGVARRENVGRELGTEQTTRERRPSREPSTNRGNSGQSNNPYYAAIEAKQNAMTVAFLRSPTAATPAGVPSSLAPDDLGYVI